MLKDIPASARPRERLLTLGPQALADAELIALLLRTGLKGKSVLQLAEQLLEAFGGLAGLLRAEPEQLRRIKGLGPAKRAEVAAVLELARRSVASELTARPVFDAPAKVKEYLHLQLGGREHEVFAVLFLDAQNRLVRLEEMFRGTLTQTSVYPREVVKRALELGAAATFRKALTAPTLIAKRSRSWCRAASSPSNCARSAASAASAMRRRSCIAVRIRASSASEPALADRSALTAGPVRRTTPRPRRGRRRDGRGRAHRRGPGRSSGSGSGTRRRARARRGPRDGCGRGSRR